MNENGEKENAFSYTYCASQQQEIREIRRKYLPPEEDKMTQVRKLDAGVTRKGTLKSISLGGIGCLLLGLGLSCTTTFADVWFVPGIIVGMIGIAAMAAAYPVYNHVVRKERARIAQQIIELTDELLK